MEETKTNCPVCGNSQAKFKSSIPGKSKDSSGIECPRCGDFYCKFIFQNNKLNLDEVELGKICGYIRENPNISLSLNDLEDLRSIKMPSVGEKAEKLMLYLAKESKIPSKFVKIYYSSDILGIMWSVNTDELNYIIQEYLAKCKQYLNYYTYDDRIEVKIAPQGWDYIESLRSVNAESKTAFVAMRLNPELVETVYKTAIKPAIEECGYNAKIMSEHNHISKIDDEIIAQIKRSKFVVADFTEQNQGAYYEAGFARGLGLKVISTCEKTEVDNNKLHFDTRQYRTILWEKGKIGAFQKELKLCIEANIGLAR